MNFKRYLPQIIAIALFFIITAAFFSPLVFDGKRVRQGDITQFEGSAREIKDYREKTGEEALWTNSMFGGMPAYQISVMYRNNLVQYIQKFFIKLMPAPATFILLCMVGFYFLMLAFKVDPWLSVAGAIAFGLTSYLITLVPAGHNTKGFAIAYMAPVLMGVILTLRGRLLLGGALTAISLALEMYSNHLQITYYLMILVLFVGIGEAIRLIRAKEMNYLFKAAGILIAAVVLAVLPNYPNLALTNEYGKASTRGQSEITVDSKQQKKTSGLPIEYATQWSYSKGETFTLMIPDFHGGASEPISTYDKEALEDVDPNFREYVGGAFSSYFGNVIFTSGPYYFGAIICFLFILGLFIVRDSIKWWLLGATILSILLAWGRHLPGLTEFFFHNIPGYNKFRAVSMVLVIAQLTMPLLAMLTLREIVKNPGVIKERMRMFYLSFALTGGICLLVALSPSTFVEPIKDKDIAKITKDVESQQGSKQDIDAVTFNLQEARLNVVSSDAWRSFTMILLASALVWLYARKPFGMLPLAGALSLLVLIDMWGVSHRYIGDENYEKNKKTTAEFTRTAADDMILADKDPHYRVLNLSVDPWQDATTSYYHKSIGGYHGAKLKRIQELYENVMDKNINAVGTALNSQNDSIIQIALSRLATLNMLNTKYIIYNPEGGVLPNRYACGNAWFVKEIKIVQNSDEELKSLDTLSSKNTAVVEKSFSLAPASFAVDSAATIRLTSYGPNKLTYESNTSREQFAVFSEVYYDKGWNAYIDGNPVPHVRADFVLRALKVPAGKHNIEFRFEPKLYFVGEKVALAGSLLLFLSVIGAIFYEVRKMKKVKAKVPVTV